MKKSSNTEEFVEKARLAHGDRYDYSKVEYKKAREKVSIICPTHGEFTQIPDSHLRGQGCPKCAIQKQIEKQSSNTEEFIEKAKQVHGNIYNYSKVDYVNIREKICIICPIHEEFYQAPDKHLQGQGCPICKNDKIGDTLRKDLNDFIEQAKQKHGEKYDYSKVDYVNDRKKICIICPIHGEFSQTPGHHLRGYGCEKCGIIKQIEKQSSNREEFIEKAKKVHGNKYNYDKLEYKTAKEKVSIICKEHGEFWMTPNNHLRGKGCNECGVINIKIKQTPTREEFIEKAKKVHGDKYDYSKVIYENARKNVIIICPIHGEFIQTPDSHLQGQGCPICSESKLEKETAKLLKEKGITFFREHKFSWLKHKKPLPLDFYLPKYNIAIECQGIQHFVAVRFGGITIEKANKNLKYLQNNDRIKKSTLRRK